MLLYHAIRKTYDDFEEVHQYYLEGLDGTLIETDKVLKPGLVIILKDINEYAITVKSIWNENGQKCFSHESAEEQIVRARIPRG
ncbi:hypothetical protein [Bacillus atrophaeus]|uniref:hypothetical protein n=1 Tax=Bacillus atrophaeus TaxID=1452 RepID=UPI0018F1AEA1|nr:hypothetical protein [Bacillus atrophaeus]MEC1903505.1 hypothetical protein [Bacillus atrophaeus]MEC2399238.1 hypothetical protein [Bacillus atrophaeus]MED4437605.1 hypothetical protein [Bacillus atrophaeus]MED4565334.1 hypothetical protein [Bacillus atrophaeus]MED4575805.1 hypothetical protein [Bacillus atrophaeus]